MLKFFAEKMWVAFAMQKAKATHIFSAKIIRILCSESAKTVNEMTLNELVKLTTLWTTGPRLQSDYLIQFVVNSWYKFKHLMTNRCSANPDLLASSEANWSGSTLFANTGHIWVQQDQG